MAAEVSMVAAEVTMVTAAADIPMSVTMAAATTVDTLAMVGTELTAGMGATIATADIGAIHTTTMDGRIGFGDGHGDTHTVLGITLRPLRHLPLTRKNVLRATHVLLTRTVTSHRPIPAYSPRVTPQNHRSPS